MICTRFSVVVAAAMLMLTVQARSYAGAPLFESDESIALTLKAPFDQLFHSGPDAEVSGTLTVDRQTFDVHVSVRGHTSAEPTECSFPKLKVSLAREPESGPLAGVRKLKIGTHCGDAPGSQLSSKYGRLANERSPVREAFVYRLLGLMEVPTLKARPARITYVFGEDRPPLVRASMLLEDDDAARKRLGAADEIAPERFSNAASMFSREDLAHVLFGEAMVGNFDWCLRIDPADTYRCDARKGLWNVMALERAGGGAIPVIYDLDLAGMVTGRHTWFQKIYNPAFVASSSAAEIEVLSQLQRARSILTRGELDTTRRAFLAKKGEAYQLVDRSGIDPDGVEAIRRYLDAFFGAIENDERFYLPVVAAEGTQAYLDAGGTQPACGARSEVPVGTPVSAPVATSGDLIQVRLLDAQWHWTEKNSCDAVRMGAVWIDAHAVDRDFPKR